MHNTFLYIYTLQDWTGKLASVVEDLTICTSAPLSWIVPTWTGIHGRHKHKIRRFMVSGTNVRIQTLPGDKKKETSDIEVRVLPVPLDGGVTEYLATSIFDESFTAEDFKELYFMRWPIESKYGDLKNQFLLEEFSGATSTSVEQEFFYKSVAFQYRCSAKVRSR